MVRGLEGLQILVIIVAGPFMLLLITMCVSLLKALREEPPESTRPARDRNVAWRAGGEVRLNSGSVSLLDRGGGSSRSLELFRITHTVAYSATISTSSITE